MASNKNIFSLEGTTVVLAGADGLIGKSIARMLKDQGADLVSVDLNWEADASAQRYRVNIADELALTKFFAELKKSKSQSKRWGFINSTYPHTPEWRTFQFENFTMDQWNQNVALHLGSTFHFTQQAVILMRELNATGSLVNFGSIYGELGPDLRIYEGTPMLNPAAYSAIKGGVAGLTRWVATAFGQHNIRANTIAPGGVQDRQPESFVEAYKKRCPMGRMGTPDDMAGAVTFLVSPAAQYVNGQTLLVDGGWSAW